MSSAISASKQVCYRIPDNGFFKNENLLKIFLSYLRNDDLKELLDVDACREITQRASMTGAQLCSELAARRLLELYPNHTLNEKESFTLQYQDLCDRTRTNMQRGIYCDRVLSGHTDSVTCFAMTEEGFASGSRDKTVRLWDRQGNLIRTLTGHRAMVTCLTSAEGRIVSGSHDSTIRLWDHQGNHVRTLDGHTHKVSCLIFANGRIVSGSSDRTVRLWDHQGNAVRTLAGHTNDVNCLASIGELIVSGSNDYTIRLWDLQGNPVRTLNGHTDSVHCLTSIGGLIVSGSFDNTIRFWGLQGNSVKILTWHKSCVNFLTPIGELIAGGSQDPIIRFWDHQGNIVGTLCGGDTFGVRCLMPTPGGFVSGPCGESFRLWDFSVTPVAVWDQLAKEFSRRKNRYGSSFADLLRRVEAMPDKKEVFEALARCMKQEAEAAKNPWNDAYDGCGKDALYGNKLCAASRVATPKQISQAITAYLYKTAKAASQQPENKDSKDSKDNKQG